MVSSLYYTEFTHNVLSITNPRHNYGEGLFQSVIYPVRNQKFLIGNGASS